MKVDAATILDRSVEWARERARVDVRGELLEGAPAEVLVESAPAADLVFLRGVLNLSGKQLARSKAGVLIRPESPYRLTWTVQGLYPDDPPRFYETPYGYGRAGAEADIAAAGWDAELDDVRIEVDTRAVDLAEGYVLGSPLSQDLAARDADPDTVVRALVDAFRRAYGSERFTMTHMATVITARA